MLVKLENFADVYDMHGYEAATKLMIEISRSLPKVLRAADLVTKINDDSFFILLPETPIKNANVVVDKLRGEIAELAVFVGMTEVRAEARIDHVAYPREGSDANEIVAELLPPEEPAAHHSTG